ncbi:MAG: hypothetical protein HC888_00690 [Candidatus Competibacteraceae bacterium]|nr:hypothetical protein [Candidatus Competibacteraceae bacterium]
MEEIDAMLENMTWHNWFDSLLILADAFSERSMDDEELVCRWLFYNGRRPHWGNAYPRSKDGFSFWIPLSSDYQEPINEWELPKSIVGFVDRINRKERSPHIKNQLTPLLLIGGRAVIMFCCDVFFHLENFPRSDDSRFLTKLSELNWQETCKLSSKWRS